MRKNFFDFSQNIFAFKNWFSIRLLLFGATKNPAQNCTGLTKTKRATKAFPLP
jgi:hypothetical protein